MVVRKEATIIDENEIGWETWGILVDGETLLATARSNGFIETYTSRQKARRRAWEFVSEHQRRGWPYPKLKVVSLWITVQN